MDILKFPDEVLSVLAAQLPPSLRFSTFSLAHSRLRAAAEHTTKTQACISHTFALHHNYRDELYGYGRYGRFNALLKPD